MRWLFLPLTLIWLSGCMAPQLGPARSSPPKEVSAADEYVEFVVPIRGTAPPGFDKVDVPTTCKIKWFSPDGKLFKQEFLMGYGTRVQVFLPIRHTEAANKPGRWRLVVEEKTGEMREREFVLK